MYALIKNGQVERYPYSVGQLKQDNPQVSFPSSMTIAVLAEHGVVPVTQTSQPDVDLTKNVTEGTPTLIEGVWTQTWVVTDATPTEIAERQQALVPRTVSMRQARLALLQYGLLDQVNAAVDAGGEADRITWGYATEVRREDSLTQNMAMALGLTEENLDALFTLASTL